MTGLRERKKQRTRDALVRVAHELFVSHGYEETTVDAITEAVDVSQRTFFRYFAGKEDVAFTMLDELDARFHDAVVARPPGESPIRALRNAVEDTWETMHEAIQEVVPIGLHMRMWQVIETTPALVAVHMRRSTAMEDRLAEVLAARENLDPRTDFRPRVLVASFSGVMRTAGRQWGCGEDLTVERARQVMNHFLDLMGPVLSDGWGGHPAPMVPRPVTD